MIVLNATTQSLEILMSAAADTTNPAFMTAYADNTGSVFTEGNHSGALSGTTAVTVVAAPGASTRRMVKEICVFNDAAAEVTITLRLNNNGTYRNLAQANIAPNGSWRWTKPAGAKGDKGETGAAIVSAAFSGDDLVFTKDDTNTVTLADAKIDLKGDTGTAGKTWHNGSGAPGDGTGVDGDFYLDTAADAYYGPKAAGTWTGTGPTSLIGPDGDMTNPMTAAGDIIYGGASGTPTRLAKGTAAQALVMNSGATAPEWGTVASGLPLGYISGLTIAHAADTEHDITVAAGEARDATDTDDMVLAAAITKRFDAAFAVGDTNGGMAEGESLPASGTIHIWLIKRSDTGVVDVMANDHATSGLTPTLPTDYDYKRRIFSLRTAASNNIINGDQWGTANIREWRYDVPIKDVDTANPGTSAVTASLSVPAGITCRAEISIQTNAAEEAIVYVSSLVSTDSVPSRSNAILNMNPAYDAAAGQWCPLAIGGQRVVTDTSSQIRYRLGASSGATIFRIGTHAWEDSL